MKEGLSEKPKVKLVAWSQGPSDMGPEELCAYGALACRSEKTSLELFLEDKEKLSRKEISKKIERVLDLTISSGHLSVMDQAEFTFVIKGLPRLATLQLCQPQYLQHLQQSLRVAKARDFYISDAIKGSKLFDEAVALHYKSFSLYEEMSNNGIPGEDARFILPLDTKTNIQTKGNARELMHLHHMNKQEFMPSIIRVLDEIMMSAARAVALVLFKERKTKDEGLAWYPGAQLFAFKNKGLEAIIAEYGKADVSLVPNDALRLSEEGINRAVRERNEAYLANLKHLHYTFLAKMSLSCFHQAIRQRTWDQSVESIYHAAERGEFVVPPSIKNNPHTLSRYNDLNNELLELYWDLVADGVPQQEAVGVLSHALSVYDLIHVNGWNAFYAIGKRTCTKAQWEVRSKAHEMAKMIQADNPVLGQYAQPQGIVLGGCPETKPCGYCEKVLERSE